jgi:hypothetical protein
MINNDLEYGRRRRDLSKYIALKRRLELLFKDLEWQDEQLLSFLESRISQTSEALSHYQKRLEAQVDATALSNLSCLPPALIQSRLWLGWSQKELADRTGLTSVKICRYERAEYASTNLRTVMRIARAITHGLESSETKG